MFPLRTTGLVCVLFASVLTAEEPRLRFLTEPHFRTPEYLYGVQAHPNGKEIALIAAGQIAFMDMQTGSLLRWFAIDRPHSTTPVQLTPNGEEVFVVGDRYISFYSSTTGKVVRQLDKHALKTNGDFSTVSPDGKRVLLFDCYGDIKSVLVDLTTGKEISRVLHRPFDVGGVALQPDGQHLLSWFMAKEMLRTDDEQQHPANEVLQRWDITGKRVVKQWSPGKGPIQRAAYSLDGTRLAVVLEKSLQIFDAKDTLLQTIDGDGDGTWQVVFSLDNKCVCVAKRYEYLTYRLSDSQLVATVKRVDGYGQNSVVQPLPDGRMLVAKRHRQVVQLWDVITNQRVTKEVPGPQGVVQEMRFANDGKTLRVTHDAPNFFAWDLTTTPPRLTTIPLQDKPEHGVGGVRFTSNGGLVAGGEKVLRYFDTKGKQEHSVPLPESCYVLDLAPDNTAFARLQATRFTGFRNEWATASIVEQYSKRNGERFHAIEIAGAPQTLRYSPDGKLLVVQTAHGDNLQLSRDPARVLTVIHAPTGRQLAQTETPGQRFQRAMLLFRDERTLLRFNPTAELLDATTLKPRPMPPNYLHNCRLRDGAIVSPNHRWLLGCTTEKYDNGGPPAAPRIEVWDLWTGQKFLTFKHDVPAERFAFTADSRGFAASFADGQIALGSLDEDVPLTKPNASDIKSLWEELASADPKKAQVTIRRLALLPQETTAFLQERLKPQKLNLQGVAEAIAKLDSNQFRERETATKTLVDLGPNVRPLLEQHLRDAQGPEMRYRLEKLLERIPFAGSDCDPRWLQGVRAIEVLDRIGTPDAKRLLTTLADSVDNPQTRAAKEVLERRKD